MKGRSLRTEAKNAQVAIKASPESKKVTGTMNYFLKLIKKATEMKAFDKK